jgi:hypothetical protein
MAVYPLEWAGTTAWPCHTIETRKFTYDFLYASHRDTRSQKQRRFQISDWIKFMSLDIYDSPSCIVSRCPLVIRAAVKVVLVVGNTLDENRAFGALELRGFWSFHHTFLVGAAGTFKTRIHASNQGTHDGFRKHLFLREFTVSQQRLWCIFVVCVGKEGENRRGGEDESGGNHDGTSWIVRRCSRLAKSSVIVQE